MADMSHLPAPLAAHTTTFHSRVPGALTDTKNASHFGVLAGENASLACKQTSVVVGVDEAGRGPVIGPMVYSAAYCTLEYYETGISSCGFADSKKLTDDRRRELFLDIAASEELGYISTYMTARDISSQMLAPWNLIKNLNEQAHDCTMGLIADLLDKGLNIQYLYIDTVGPPESYQRKLQTRFPGIGTIRVEKKADDKFPIVSGASVCAKVSRDQWVDGLGLAAGSGYPSDPNTKRWLRDNVHCWHGWNESIRYSWSTARELLKTSDGVIGMEFADDDPKVQKVGIEDMFSAAARKKTVGVSIGDFVKC